jgi:hypothetical protein
VRKKRFWRKDRLSMLERSRKRYRYNLREHPPLNLPSRGCPVSTLSR